MRNKGRKAPHITKGPKTSPLSQQLCRSAFFSCRDAKVKARSRAKRPSMAAASTGGVPGVPKPQTKRPAAAWRLCSAWWGISMTPVVGVNPTHALCQHRLKRFFCNRKMKITRKKTIRKSPSGYNSTFQKPEAFRVSQPRDKAQWLESLQRGPCCDPKNLHLGRSGRAPGGAKTFGSQKSAKPTI